jgi:hypothetical protein
MNGAIGNYVKAAALGVTTARKHLKGVFCEPFQTVAGWDKALAPIPGGDVEILLDRRGAWWTRECFQALYVACWIFHPVEKGSYMIQLSPQRLANVREAYDRLLASGDLTARISSHLSKEGASAHKGWAFLKGYEELLVQIEGEGTGSPYLFLKCEGHALTGFGLSTILHGASWVKKSLTGSGATANPALKRLAGNTANVEARAAENFSTSYKKVLKRLGLSGKMVTVGEMLEAMHGRRASPEGSPPRSRETPTSWAGPCWAPPGTSPSSAAGRTNSGRTG